MSETSEKKRKNVSNERFLEVYNTANSVKEAAETLGVEVMTVKSRASKLRSLDVPLKEFSRGKRIKLSEDADKLARLKELSQSYLGKQE